MTPHYRVKSCQVILSRLCFTSKQSVGLSEIQLFIYKGPKGVGEVVSLV